LPFVEDAYADGVGPRISIRSITHTLGGWNADTDPQDVWSGTFSAGISGGSSTTPPYGALVFFDAKSGYNPEDFSHVEIMGPNGEMIGTPGTPGRAVFEETLAQHEATRDYNTYIGWWLPDGATESPAIGRLSVIAGGGRRWPPSGSATSSDLDNPTGLAVDSHGDLFIADGGNEPVEEVTPAGRLSVLAGVAGRAARVTPGRAANSVLGVPHGVAVNAHGDLFIADMLSDVVEEITPAGRLSVIAGVTGKYGLPTPGPAARSKLDDPIGVAVDARGDLFIADTGSSVAHWLRS
jgi:hypothetical protein